MLLFFCFLFCLLFFISFLPLLSYFQLILFSFSLLFLSWVSVLKVFISRSDFCPSSRRCTKAYYGLVPVRLKIMYFKKSLAILMWSDPMGLFSQFFYKKTLFPDWHQCRRWKAKLKIDYTFTLKILLLILLFLLDWLGEDLRPYLFICFKRPHTFPCNLFSFCIGSSGIYTIKIINTT